MEEYLVFDEKKVITSAGTPTYHIKYYLLHSENDTTEMDTMEKLKTSSAWLENDNYEPCFSQVYRHINAFVVKYTVPPNRIVYIDSRNKYYQFGKNDTNLNKYPLSVDEIKRWVELCKENKLMPKNIGDNFINNGDFDINVENISMNMFYIFSSAA